MAYENKPREAMMARLRWVILAGVGWCINNPGTSPRDGVGPLWAWAKNLSSSGLETSNTESFLLFGLKVNIVHPHLHLLSLPTHSACAVTLVDVFSEIVVCFDNTNNSYPFIFITLAQQNTLTSLRSSIGRVIRFANCRVSALERPRRYLLAR